MQTIATVGLDIAKSVVHSPPVEAARYVLALFQPPCLIGLEACASSHYWSRELQALGHTVRLMPAAYVKPYLKRQKNDATDAEAISEAVTQGKHTVRRDQTPEQQSCLMLSHATSAHSPADRRDRCNPRPSSGVRDRGAAQASWGRRTTRGRGRSARQTGTRGARACLVAQGVQLRVLKNQILEFDRIINA
jgi:transposase